MTDKATIEITSPKSGTVHKLHCGEGDTIEVHTPLIEINTERGHFIHQKPDSENQGSCSCSHHTKENGTRHPCCQKNHTNTDSALDNNCKGIGISSCPGLCKCQRNRSYWYSRNGKRRSHLTCRCRSHSHCSHPVRPPAIQTSAPTGEDEEIASSVYAERLREKMLESVQRAPHFTYVDEVDATELVSCEKNSSPSRRQKE